MANTSFSIHGSFMYLPFLAKICLSRIHLTIKSAGKILWMSKMFTFLSLPVSWETSNCLVPISLTTLKFGTCFASQVDFLSKCLIIIKSPILNLGTSLCLLCSCLEHASFVLRVVKMYPNRLLTLFVSIIECTLKLLKQRKLIILDKLLLPSC